MKRRIIALYALFAGISTVVNIGAQSLSSRLYSGRYSFFAALIIGTFLGLLAKYVLDKRYIFKYKASGIRTDVVSFILYSIMGIATTVEFWIVEYLFHRFVAFDNSRYVGAVIGLGLGYILKYNLDKRFVFRKSAE